MTEGQLFLKTFQKEVNTEKKDKKQIDSYDPSRSSRELNPHWRDGGKGLPSFQKPKDDDEDYDNGNDRRSKNYFTSSSSAKYSGNWRKNEVSSTRTSRDYERDPDPRKEIEDKHDRRESSKSRRNRSRSRESESRTKRRSRSKDPESKSRRRQSRSRSKDPESKSSKRRSRSKSNESNSNCSRNNSPQKSQKANASDGNDDSFLTDEQMNQLGAKLIKAEIMGNNELAKELKDKLEKAREVRKNIKDKPKIPQKQQQRKQEQPSTSKTKEKNTTKEEHILLTTTNSKGMTKPLSSSSSHHPFSHDPWGGRKANKRKQKTETHIDGERVRYFPDDDRYDIKQMFEREKYTTAHDSDAQFIEIAGKHKERSKDDLDDIFADKVRESISDYDQNKKEIKRAIDEHERYTKILESCDKCFDSLKMNKSHMIAMGNNVYLSIPYEQGLQTGHCCIIPMQHITCSTQLDEDTWNEINEFRKSLTRMFSEKKSQDVIFFEIANYLHKKPHMIIHCIPSDNFELAPMYFKKAIQESEYEWSTNKQLITLKEKDLRRSIPKGLPYFWVNFGMDLGFAHVIEDQHKFKPNFAQEIIGGMLNLDAKTWRKPRKEHHYIEKVKKFAEMWKPYDFTS